jgi:hypothetical protein
MTSVQNKMTFIDVEWAQCFLITRNKVCHETLKTRFVHNTSNGRQADRQFMDDIVIVLRQSVVLVTQIKPVNQFLSVKTGSGDDVLPLEF